METDQRSHTLQMKTSEAENPAPALGNNEEMEKVQVPGLRQINEILDKSNSDSRQFDARNMDGNQAPLPVDTKDTSDQYNPNFGVSTDIGDTDPQLLCSTRIKEAPNAASTDIDPSSEKKEDLDDGMSTNTPNCPQPLCPTIIYDEQMTARPEKRQIEADERQGLDDAIPAIKRCKIEGSFSPHAKSTEDAILPIKTSREAMDIGIESGKISLAPSDPSASIKPSRQVPRSIQILETTVPSESGLREYAHALNSNNPESLGQEDPGHDSISSGVLITGATNAQQDSNPQSDVSSPLTSLSESQPTDSSTVSLDKPHLRSPTKSWKDRSTSPQGDLSKSPPVHHQSGSQGLPSIDFPTFNFINSSVARQPSVLVDTTLSFAGLLLPVSNDHPSGSSSPRQNIGSSTSPGASNTALDILQQGNESKSPSEPCLKLLTPAARTALEEAPLPPTTKTKKPPGGTVINSQRTESSSPNSTAGLSRGQQPPPLDSLVKIEKSLRGLAPIDTSMSRLRSSTKSSAPESNPPRGPIHIDLSDKDEPDEVFAVEEAVPKKASVKKRLATTQSTKAQEMESQANKALKRQVTRAQVVIRSNTESQTVETQVVRAQKGRPRKVQNVVLRSKPEPVLIVQSVKPHTEGFPRFEKGIVYIQLSTSNQKYSYQLHSFVLALVSPWFKSALEGEVTEANEIVAKKIRTENRLTTRFEFDFRVDMEIGTLRRVPFTKTQMVDKSIDNGILEVNKRSRAEFKQAASIAQDEPKFCYTIGQQEVLEAYNNLFLTYYRLTPNINHNDIQQAFHQTRRLLDIAEIYGSAHIVRPYLNSLLTQFGRDLYRDILHKPLQWLSLSLQLESGLIFREALIHIVGNHKHWRRDVIDDLKFPPELLALIIRKISELKALKVGIDTELFTSGICVNGTEIMLNKSDPATFNTWIVAMCWSNWYSRVLAEASVTKKSCTDGVIYRQMARGGDAYLHPTSVFAMVKRLRGQAFKPTDEPGIEEDLAMMKTFAQRKVQPLCVNNSMLSIEEEDIKYFTCTKIEDLDLPWMTWLSRDS